VTGLKGEPCATSTSLSFPCPDATLAEHTPQARADVHGTCSGHGGDSGCRSQQRRIKRWSTTDSLYGSRHLAAELAEQGMQARISSVIAVDMVADAQLDIRPESHSTPWLNDAVLNQARRLGYARGLSARVSGITVSISGPRAPSCGAETGSSGDMNSGLGVVPLGRSTVMFGAELLSGRVVSGCRTRNLGWWVSSN